ncbi:glycosyltransferase family 2 protein [Brevibacterium yomogidense]|uniref:glycosyltransferase family 2 protein n=1 Tax=Brevibacterium yomogidense TaxID=946573 RepID=UPI0018DF9373|nr:glycosyltransferase [Brevibacterium yomogidense]
MPARTSAQWGAATNGTPDEHAPLPPVGGPDLDVLLPCFERPAELAVTLAGLAGQTDADFAVLLSDQSSPPVWEDQTVTSMLTLLRAQGRIVICHRNLPQRGLAQQRQFLLEHSVAAHVLFLDSDVWLEPGTLTRLQEALTSSGAGFVGSAVQGLSYLDDVRPEEWRSFELWEGPVEPEPIPDSGPAHERWQLHNAANLAHIAARTDFGDRDFLLYRVAWIGACVLYDAAKLRAAGGFEFWEDLPPEHAGEDVLAQWQVMHRFGGAGLLPSGAVHLETDTTITERGTEAIELLDGPRDHGAS